MSRMAWWSGTQRQHRPSKSEWCRLSAYHPGAQPPSPSIHCLGWRIWLWQSFTIVTGSTRVPNSWAGGSYPATLETGVEANLESCWCDWGAIASACWFCSCSSSLQHHQWLRFWISTRLAVRATSSWSDTGRHELPRPRSPTSSLSNPSIHWWVKSTSRCSWSWHCPSIWVQQWVCLRWSLEQSHPIGRTCGTWRKRRSHLGPALGYSIE